MIHQADQWLRSVKGRNDNRYLQAFNESVSRTFSWIEAGKKGLGTEKNSPERKPIGRQV